MTLYPYRELAITSKVQECCGWEVAAELVNFKYSACIAISELKSGVSPFSPMAHTYVTLVHANSIVITSTVSGICCQKYARHPVPKELKVSDESFHEFL